MKIDEKDYKIIQVLRENARSSITQIAKKTKIRPSTVHMRIEKLVQNGIIDRFTLKLNNKAVGENFIVFMLIETTKEIEPEAFRDHHVKEVFGITGEYDLLLKMKFRDIEEFNTFVLTFRKRYALRKTLTMVATIAIKEEI